MLARSLQLSFSMVNEWREMVCWFVQSAQCIHNEYILISFVCLCVFLFFFLIIFSSNGTAFSFQGNRNKNTLQFILNDHKALHVTFIEQVLFVWWKAIKFYFIVKIQMNLDFECRCECFPWKWSMNWGRSDFNYNFKMSIQRVTVSTGKKIMKRSKHQIDTWISN